ncbi:MAG: EamA family transporter [Sciscionella sp.]
MVSAQREPARALRAGRVVVAGVFGRVPPPALVLLGIVSVQVGAALATRLFTVTGPAGAVALRLFFAGAILLAVCRPSLRLGLRAWVAVLGYGLVLATMNICFYQAIARIPLGMAVTIEFLGPLTVSLLGSRRWTHAVWAALAAAGVVLLTEGGGAVDWLGVVFAASAGACWGGYIMMGALLGRRTTGASGLAWGMAFAAMLAVPFGVADSGTAVLQPVALVAGLGVALLSSVVPYSVELEALRRIPPRVFGILMSMEPAVAALAGLVVLGERLGTVQWIAICCVVAASVGATRST